MNGMEGSDTTAPITAQTRAVVAVPLTAKAIWLNRGLLTFCVLAVIALGLGARYAMRSSLFLVQSVNVTEPPVGSPADASTIRALAAIPVHQINLFALPLAEVEARVMAHPWIKRVILQKQLPSTLKIEVEFRKAQAIVQLSGGALTYMDEDGQLFGKVTAGKFSDLPFLSGFEKSRLDETQRLRDAMSILAGWKKAGLEGVSQLASLTYDVERGFLAWVIYPANSQIVRTIVSVGQEIDGGIDVRLSRLNSVIRYLIQNGIHARSIWNESEKKVVVKRAEDS